ncbi:MAG TPA: hypothetical protein VET69_06565, partial [Terriglobales bacterium]|nr:hypothetical protein [Terriglobales bacterium]
MNLQQKWAQKFMEDERGAIRRQESRQIWLGYKILNEVLCFPLDRNFAAICERMSIVLLTNPVL